MYKNTPIKKLVSSSPTQIQRCKNKLKNSIKNEKKSNKVVITQKPRQILQKPEIIPVQPIITLGSTLNPPQTNAILRSSSILLRSSNFMPHSEQNGQSKQLSTHQLKLSYLQTKLASKVAKLQEIQEKNRQLNATIQKLHKQVELKNLDNLNLQKEKNFLQHRQKQLEDQLQKFVRMGIQKDKKIAGAEVQVIKHSKNKQNCESLTNHLTKQNTSLINQLALHKSQITALEQELLELEKVLALQKQSSNLLANLNSQLKLQIQQLLFQLRRKKWREEVDWLGQYEYQVQNRLARYANDQKKAFPLNDSQEDMTQQQNTNNPQKQNKSNEHDNLKQKLQYSQQLIDLLKQKLYSLQKKLQASESRCKELQKIIISK